MSWIGALRPASFRGLEFGVLGASKDFGKRVITHLFPLRDEPFHEEMGRRERGFTVDAFIVGENVIARVAALEAALEKKGSGRLVHPYYGSLTVVALPSNTSWSAVEGRVARIQMAFEEAGKSPAPAGLLNTLAALLSAIGGTVSIVLDIAASVVQLVGQPSFVAAAMASDVRSLGQTIGRTLSVAGLSGRSADLGTVVVPAIGRPVTVQAALSRMMAMRADDLGDGSAALVLASRTIAALALVPVPVKAFSSDRDEGVGLVEAILAVAAAAPPPVATAPTSSGAAIAANKSAVAVLVRATAAAAAAEAAGNVQWDSRDQLDLYADRIADVLSDAADLAGERGWDDAWRATSDLASSWSGHVAAVSPPLPRVSAIVPVSALPASLLAYRLDGDDLATVFARGGSIARRNRARHPGFLAGGQPLEVVGNG